MEELIASSIQKREEKSSFICEKADSDEAKKVSNNCDEQYFVNVSIVKGKIEEAEKIIKSMDEKHHQIYREIKEKKVTSLFFQYFYFILWLPIRIVKIINFGLHVFSFE